MLLVSRCDFHWHVQILSTARFGRVVIWGETLWRCSWEQPENPGIHRTEQKQCNQKNGCHLICDRCILLITTYSCHMFSAKSGVVIMLKVRLKQYCSYDVWHCYQFSQVHIELPVKSKLLQCPGARCWTCHSPNISYIHYFKLEGRTSKSEVWVGVRCQIVLATEGTRRTNSK